MTEGPFTDDHARQWLLSVQTQAGIIKYAKAMAVVLAEAGRASEKVTGDRPEYAVRQWVKIIEQEALRLLREECIRQSGTKNETLMSTLPSSAATSPNRLLEGTVNPEHPTASVATKNSSSR